MYAYLGRAITHSAPITGIEFGIRESGEVLVSVGEDRYLYIRFIIFIYTIQKYMFYN